MRRIFQSLLSVAVAATVSTGCSNEIDTFDPAHPETVTMTVIASNEIENAPDAQSRTHHDGTNSIKWDSQGETIAMLQKVAGAAGNMDEQNSTNCTVNTDGTAAFTISFEAKDATDFTYAAVYPAAALASGNADMNQVKVILPSSQTPTATSFDPKADLMVTKTVARTSQPTTEDPLHLQFGRVAALATMTINNLGLTTGETVQKVTFSATGKTLAGRSYINFADGQITKIGYYGATEEITANMSALGITAASFPVWFTCMPTSLVAGDSFTVVVTTNKNVFTKAVTLSGSQNLVFSVGNRSIFSVDMAGIVGEENIVSDARSATLTYDKFGTLSYGTPVEYDAGNNTIWRVAGYKTSATNGIQLNSSTTNDPRIELPHFSNPITIVSITIGKGTSGKSVYLYNESNERIAVMDSAVGTFDFSFTPSDTFKFGIIRADGVTVITEVTVKTGTAISCANITGVAATGVTDAPTTYLAAAFSTDDDTTVTYDGSIVTAATINNATKTVTYSVSANTTGAAREGWFTLTSAANDATTTVKVSQVADKFEVAPTTVVLGGNANDTGTFTLTSDFATTFTVSDPTKFSVSPTGNVYTVTALADGTDATADLGTITITRTIDNKPLEVAVSQSAKGSSAAQTVTYTVTSTTAISTSGTAPTSSNATFKNTYTNASTDKGQMTKNNSTTLTLNGYAGCKITGITLSMKSNKSAGTGTLNITAGTTTIASIAAASFSSPNWYGSWSQSYVDVTPTVTPYTVQNSETITVTIAATASSLYIQSYTITYEN